MSQIQMKRSDVRLDPDPRRLITKPYLPADLATSAGKSRVRHVIDRILEMPTEEAAATLCRIRNDFGDRHGDLDGLLHRGFSAVAHEVPDPAGLSIETCRLIGAYFMHEYSIEGAAFTNPSIVEAPDQSGVPAGSVRVIISVRAVGEGHISSIEFRTGLVGPDASITVDHPAPPVSGDRRAPVFDRSLFIQKLHEIGAREDLVDDTLLDLGAEFTMPDLDRALLQLDQRSRHTTAAQHVIQVIHWLASSNYDLSFPPESDISQRVLFPAGPSESRGMEDARMVRFSEPDGESIYYATYTAFDGFSILPQMIETSDFKTFRIATLNGRAARNKGIALFPRRVDGRYAALARSDGESNYLMVSDHVRFWHDSERIQIPTRPWELMQIGNSGSPIETSAGWLVVTHGVGPLRSYSLGAILLDLDDPRRVIGHLREPLLTPNADERDGYVPNVVYSCGSFLHNGHLLVAYGASDTSASFASVPVDELLTELTRI
jgi:predicted GH43/DUF377 family glycosyl hydrolase